MRRYLVRLEARDLAAVEGNTALGDRLASAMRDAAATASEPVSAVVFGLMLER
jgi:RNA-splicing ligase RtcB